MAKFYEKMLKQGVRPAAALRAAQVEMWKQKQWQSPYYWAAFTMQAGSDNRPKNHPARENIYEGG